MKTNTTGIEQGLRSMAIRTLNAETAFIETLMELGEISKGEAARVLFLYRKLRLVKMDAVGGAISVKHGAYLDRATIKQAVAMALGQT